MFVRMKVHKQKSVRICIHIRNILLSLKINLLLITNLNSSNDSTSKFVYAQIKGSKRVTGG